VSTTEIRFGCRPKSSPVEGITIRIEAVESGTQDRFARFRLVPWWDQTRLAQARVLVVGAGALGNEILKNLALLGVGNVLVADMDTVEDSNLSRSVLFRHEDSGRRKSEVAATAARAIYPDMKTHWFHGDVTFDLGLGAYRWADVVIAGLDNRFARLCVNRNCWRVGRPWVDGAIYGIDGLARVFLPPGGACYECTLGDVDRQILKARQACRALSRGDMLEGKVPTTPTSASVIAGIQCQEAVKLLHGLEVLKSRCFYFSGLAHNSYTYSYQRREECESHDTYAGIRPLGGGAAGRRLGDVLELVKSELGPHAVLEFNQEILHRLACPACGAADTVLKSLGRFSEQDARCPNCGESRREETLHSIRGDEEFLSRTFADIGVPPLDIVVGRSGLRRVFLEFNGDAAAVLGPLAE
jgi:adenylyltransferase/sulfurtransferase